MSLFDSLARKVHNRTYKQQEYLYRFFHKYIFLLCSMVFSRKLNAEKLNNVLIISPHPDDETLGCGMLIKYLCDHNKTVRIVILSKGEAALPTSIILAEELKKRRKDLATKSLAQLGVPVDNVDFLDFPDAHFENVTEGSVVKLTEIISDFNPEIVLYPHPLEYSPDHLVATKIVNQILMQFCTRKMYYCVWVHYHMPISKIFKLSFIHSRFFSGDVKAKRDAIGIYTSAKTKSNHCYSGSLPKEMIKRASFEKEYYFEVV